VRPTARAGKKLPVSEASRPLTPGAARDWRRRWDAQQSGGVSDREERFEAMLELLGAHLGNRFRFLDLGAGTGSLSERILRRYPRSRGVALDFDPLLLRIARVGLRGFSPRLGWVEADLRRRDWPRALPTGRFDAAVSSTALHWLTGSQLRQLYGALGRVVRPDGLVLNADALAYPSGETRLRAIVREVRHRRRATRGAVETWDEWWSAAEQDPRFSEEVALRRRRYPHPHMGTPTPDLAGHVRRLKAAGFREVDVVWSHGQNRVLAAVR
jgi:SAM-dependent methyltransferase